MSNISTIQLISVEDDFGLKGYSTHAIIITSDSAAPNASDVVSDVNSTFGLSIASATQVAYNVYGIPNPGTPGNTLQDAINETSIQDPNYSGSYFLFLIESGSTPGAVHNYVESNHAATSTQVSGGVVEQNVLISTWSTTSVRTVAFTPPAATGSSPFNTSTDGNVNVHDFKQRKILTARLKQSPIAVQTLRRTIIENANEMVQQFKKYRFHEISEIVRVCTALGIERAFLRGLQVSNSLGSYTVPGNEDENEKWIDKFLYRFNLNGGLPFQDISSPTASGSWKGGGEFKNPAFFYGNKNTILLQCIRIDGEAFVVCNGESIEVATQPTTRPELPLTAFIPKYRAAGYDVDIPWLPEMVCELLFNEPHPNDVCVTTTDISSTSLDRPDLNQLIPININSFPYTTPNPGFPLLNYVNPPPKKIQMVMDGTPIDGEDVILANRFELTGTVSMSPGDEATATIQSVSGFDYPTEIIIPEGGPVLTDGDTVIIDPTFLDTSVNTETPPPFPIVVENERYFSPTPIPDGVDTYYAGNVLIQRDPIVGTNTRFTEELYVNDIVELQYGASIIPGLFYTVGTGTLYYKGNYFDKVYRDNIEIVINNVKYRVTSKTLENDTLVYEGYIFEYNSKYEITRLEESYNPGVQEEVTIKMFNAVSTSVNVTPTPNNIKLATVQFTDTSIDVTETFEVGDLIQINGVYHRFKALSENLLTGVYRVDGGDIPNGISNATFVRDVKVSRAMPLDTYSVASLLPFRVYYKVNSINSDTSIDVTPSFTQTQVYEGKLYRIGFNIRSSSQSPDLINSGFNVEGVTQFLPNDAATDNSPVFYVPAAATEKVILYNSNQLTTLQSSVNGKTALPILTVKGALTGKYFTNVYDYATFSQPLNTVIFPASYNSVYDEEERGELYFTDGEDKYIILETIENNNPVSHGFSAGDILTIRKVKFDPNIKTDNPYGDLIRYDDTYFTSYMSTLDYAECGMLIEVADIVNPHRFKILKEGITCSSEANKFFHAYDIDTTYYLTATNGPELEYWAKYFSPVFMDGTITANSYGEYITDGQNVNRSLNLCSKDSNNSKLLYNYTGDASSVSYWLGSTGVNIKVNNNVVELVPGPIGAGGATTTEDGTFLLSLKEDVVHPPRLLDSFVLRVVEFEPQEF